MKILVDSQQMKQCDTCTIEYYKVPSMVLMERAALSVVEEIEKRGIDHKKVLVVCGLGNNGGDGLAIARMLFQKGSDVTVVCDMKKEKATEQTIQQYEILQRYGVSVVREIPQNQEYTLMIDAIFGIGLSREVQGHWKEEIQRVNQMSGYKLAVDIPSGLNADNGMIMGCAFRADLTVTFAYMKIGLLLYAGVACAGQIVIKDIGIDNYSFRGEKPHRFFYEKTDMELLPKRKIYSNKGTYGRVLVIAGQKNMAGAAYFSGKAAAVTGCGIVKIFTMEENRTIIQQLFPEAILDIWKEAEVHTDSFRLQLEENLRWADVIVAGPGIGTTEPSRQLIQEVLQYIEEKPLILDADALNILAKMPEKFKECKGKMILTPHMGEMARLTGMSIREIQNNVIAVAENYAKEYNVICVLKDAKTIVALPEGITYVNTSGNQGMATAGAGDVLTGVIAGLAAQGMEPAQAASLGVFLHGMAGDAILEETGSYAMLATDIIEGIKRITSIQKGIDTHF